MVSDKATYDHVEKLGHDDELVKINLGRVSRECVFGAVYFVGDIVGLCLYEW